MSKLQQQLAAVILKIRPWKACRRSSASTAPTPRSTAGAFRSISSRWKSGRFRRQRSHSPLAARAGPGQGNHAVHAAGAGFDGRDARQPDPVSIQPGRPGRQGIEPNGCRKLLAKLETLPQLRDVASDQQNEGLQAKVVIDRDTASRLGITPQMIDDALYDAFGQRQIYDPVHATEPVSRGAGGAARVSQQARRHRQHLRPFAGGRQDSAEHVHPRRAEDGAAGGQPPGAVPGGRGLVQSGAGRSLGDAVAGDRRGQATRSTCRPAFRPAFRGRPRPSRPR